MIATNPYRNNMPVSAFSRFFLCCGIALLALSWTIAKSASAETAVADRPFADEREAGMFLAAAKALGQSNWRALRQNRENLLDPHALSLLDYLELKKRGETAGFPRLEGFLSTHAGRLDWFPDASRLQRHAESALAREDLAPQRVLDYLDKFPPVSGVGMELLGEALMNTGKREEGEAAIRRAWREYPTFFPRSRDFHRRHASLLTTQDHSDRLQMLLWREDVALAKEMLQLVAADEHALAVARLRLMTLSSGVDAAIRAVPARLQGDPGLVYERVRWRRRKEREDDAMELLLRAPPPAPEHARKWWTERHILARHALEQGNHVSSYELARSHGMERGIGFAEGEFLAGWLALRFLGMPALAHEHFRRLQNGVSTPVSLARAGYWRGRAAREMARQPGAANAPDPHAAWRQASSLSTTYYGQLSGEMLEENGPLPMRPHRIVFHAPAAAFVRQADAATSEAETGFLRMASLAYAAGLEDVGDQFLLSRSRRAEEAQEFPLLSQTARHAGRTHISLRIAKRGARKHFFMEDMLFPVDAFPPSALEERGRLVEPSLLLAVARQESEFNLEAVSRAGARGMMQLLPSTARQVARNHDIGYDKSALLRDPAYNIRLGELYLGKMIARFDGSYVLAIAAYNAGPARVAGWLDRICDPRRTGCDAIDWIEKIPIGETRNYVQRVLENLQNYRRILGRDTGQGIGSDLRRGEADAASYLPANPQREP